MDGIRHALWRLALVVIALSVTQVQAIEQTYCSYLNTGTGSGTYAQFQSTGLCHDQCTATNNAFAILQGQYCWCSNYVPAQQLSISICDQGCPGDDREQCGSAADHVYGYIALAAKPSGTAGPGGSRTTGSPVSWITSAPSLSSSSSSSSTDSDAGATVTGTQVVTVSGAIVTQTVTSIRPQSTFGASAEVPQAKTNNTSMIVGAVLGSVIGLLSIVGLMLFFVWRRRRATTGKRSLVPAALKRDASVLSKSGLMGAAATSDNYRSMEESRYGGQRQSQLLADPDETSRSVGGGSQDGSGGGAGGGPLGRRNSRPLVYDQRLNPAALMENWQHNGSQNSIGTLQDQRDYSRPLGVTNPDP